MWCCGLLYYVFCGLFCFNCFFFFKQKTAYEMRISDWSSDVCSSDLVDLLGRYLAATETPISRAQAEQRMFEKLDNQNFMADVRPLLAADASEAFDDAEIGRASCRERVCQYV